jgi:hypothetical protein
VSKELGSVPRFHCSSTADERPSSRRRLPPRVKPSNDALRPEASGFAWCRKPSVTEPEVSGAIDPLSVPRTSCAADSTTARSGEGGMLSKA